MLKTKSNLKLDTKQNAGINLSIKLAGDTQYALYLKEKLPPEFPIILDIGTERILRWHLKDYVTELRYNL